MDIIGWWINSKYGQMQGSFDTHLSPGVVSLCFDDHVHNNHLVCSGCNTQSRLTLLLKIQMENIISMDF